MRPAAERLARTQQAGEPGIRKLECESRHRQGNETQAPASRVASVGTGSSAPPGGRSARRCAAIFLMNNRELCDKHSADDANDQNQINLPHPPVDLSCQNPCRALRRREVHVNFAQGKFLVRTRMAFATRFHEVRLVDRGIRIGWTVESCETRGNSRNLPRRVEPYCDGQAVVAVEESFHAVGGRLYLVFMPFRRMAAAAHLLGNFQREAPLQRLDLMFRMAVGAGGRVAHSRRQGFAVNAGCEIPGLLIMTRCRTWPPDWKYAAVRPVKSAAESRANHGNPDTSRCRRGPPSRRDRGHLPHSLRFAPRDSGDNPPAGRRIVVGMVCR